MCLSIYLSTYLSTYLSIYLSIYLSNLNNHNNHNNHNHNLYNHNHNLYIYIIIILTTYPSAYIYTYVCIALSLYPCTHVASFPTMYNRMSRKTPGCLLAPDFNDPNYAHHAVLKDVIPIPAEAPLPYPAHSMDGYELFSVQLLDSKRKYLDKFHQPRNCCAHCYRCYWRRLRLRRTPYVMPKRLRRCSGCSVTYYCDQECQEKDWSKHKHFCKDIRACRALERNWSGRRFQEFFEVLMVGQNGTRLHTPFASRGWRKRRYYTA